MWVDATMAFEFEGHFQGRNVKYGQKLIYYDLAVFSARYIILFEKISGFITECIYPVNLINVQILI